MEIYTILHIFFHSFILACNILFNWAITKPKSFTVSSTRGIPAKCTAPRVEPDGRWRAGRNAFAGPRRLSYGHPAARRTECQFWFYVDAGKTRMLPVLP